MVPTVEQYSALLCCPRIQVDKVYSRANCIPNFVRKLMNITGINEQWVTARIKQKSKCKCIPWKALKDLILTDLDEKKKVDVTPVPAILAETFQSLNAYRRAGEGRFIGCAQLLLVWFHSHFRKGAVGYTPLLVLRQYRSRQFVPATHGLAQCKFSYKGDRYKKLVKVISCAWNQTYRMKIVDVCSTTTPKYMEWWSRRVNDNILVPSLEGGRPIEEYLRVVPSELEIMKQDFEKKSS
ncbi:hypothetical protein J1N35_015752 [Gossypium stocksii]|uniref:Aminotransferase-like plant mobile domain-containing protein n=1 Tax=Gossypium stocksii TaxID=47602 RepID=A0A9D3VZ76_9ROSI|nr:hypothetical protein J1N35_015752 [Gossypium stocksii]